MKKKPIELRCYTFDSSIYELCQPSFNKKMPNWLANLPPSIEQPVTDSISELAPTVFYCPGIRDFIKQSISFYSWYEMKFLIDADGRWSEIYSKQFNELIIEHSTIQLGNNFHSDKVLLKLSSPWKLQCDEDIQFLFAENFYDSDFLRTKNITIPPGILNFKYQVSTNIHLWFNKPTELTEYHIPYRTPLISMFPLTEREITIKHILIDLNQWNQLSSMPQCPIGSYYKKLKILKDNKK